MEANWIVDRTGVEEVKRIPFGCFGVDEEGAGGCVWAMMVSPW